MSAYEEVIEFIAAGPSSSALADFEASPRTKERIAALIRKEKNEGLPPEEKTELDDCMQVEHLMILVKARARQRAAHE